MGEMVTKAAIPTETNQMYCPKCGNILPGRFKAYSYFSFINNNSRYQKYVEYDNAGIAKDVKCKCYICGSKAIPIFTNECVDIVKELNNAGFEILYVMDRAGISLAGDINISISRPLSVQIRIPQLKDITDSAAIRKVSFDEFTIERLYDDVLECSSNSGSSVLGLNVVCAIKSFINEIKAKDWYQTKYTDYMYSIKSKLDSMRNKDDSKVYKIIMSYPLMYKKDESSSLFAGIVVEDHNFLTFIGEDKSFPDGIEVVLRSSGDIEIELGSDFDVDATDKWLVSILERMDKYESVD